MSRYQDTVIDDDEESCPLCIEDFDLSDKNFKPCPCGYQICQFCFNSLKTTYEKSTCPNCRRPYDESTIQYRIPTAEELKLDQLNKNKKLAAAKRKETEKQEVETSNRRNLAGVRVKQQNLVYVIGLEPTKKDETSLMETLRGKDFFGQYGPIEKIVVSKPKIGAVNQGVGVYVTFRNKDDAATCINCVDGSPNGDKILRAQYGTTKYCSTYLRGDVCQNKNCSFLHENGEEGQNTSLQNVEIDSKPKIVPVRSQPTPQPQAIAAAEAMVRESSREGATSRQESSDGSALPPTAGWANANAPIAKARRASLAASASTASPQLTHASVAHKIPQPTKQTEIPFKPVPQPAQAASSTKTEPPPATPPATKSETTPLEPFDDILQRLKAAVSNSACAFIFDDSSLSEETRATIAAMPPLIDPYGGAKRRMMEDKQEQARAKVVADEKQRLEDQAISAAEGAMDEESMGAGSLALGGEPEDLPRSASAKAAIRRPSQATPSNVPIDQLANLGLGRSLTPQQQRQLAMMNAASTQPARLPPMSQNTAFELSDFDRRGGPQFSQAQYDQISSHARHGSRYFNSESKGNNARFPSQQQQQSGFYSSGVQGPPPGLPTAGTPPVSGGGMFAHGQGFTSSGFGASKDSESLRSRSGTNAGHDVKRGGVEHLADPSILSARLHQGTGGQGLFGGNQGEQDYPPLPKALTAQSTIHSRVSSLQSAFGDRASTPKVPPGFERVASFSERAQTPQVPPGFEDLHAHPSRIDDAAKVSPSKKEATTTGIVPVVPAISRPPPSRKSSLLVEPKHEDVKNVSAVEERPEKQGSDQGEAVDALALSGKPIEDIKLKPSLPHEDAGNATTTLADIEEEQKTIEPPKTDAAAKYVHSIPNESAKESSSVVETNSENKAVNKNPLGTQTETGSATAPEVDRKPSVILEEESVVGTPVVLSRANTPPPKRQVEAKRPTLRTLNITSEMIARSESLSQAPPSTTTERSMAFPTLSQIRQSSRQPSVSVSTNVSRPSTPAVSDRLMSQDVSRASSPPLGSSVVGSAPARQKTKAQLKKERKDKAKKAGEMSETGSVNTPVAAATPPILEPVAPIVARQKKQKKQKTLSTTEEPAQPVVEALAPEAPEEEVQVPEQIKLSKKQRKALEKQASKMELERPASPPPRTPTPPPPAEPIEPESRQSYTLRDFYTDASSTEAEYDTSDSNALAQKRAATTALLSSKISAVPRLLSELIASDDLVKDHPFFTPPPFTSPGFKLPRDERKGQAYLDGNGYSSSDAFGTVYLPNKEKRALYNGHAVSVADSGERKDDLLRRCLITPGGAVLRHLTREEGEKVLDLEERRSVYVEEFGELGRMDGLGRLEDEDFINLEGGFDELSRFGERHGVCWVYGQDEQQGAQRRQNYRRNRNASNATLENDYGLGEMPIDPNDADADEFDDEQFEDPEDEDDEEDDEEELEGEEMVLEAEDPEALEYASDDEHLAFETTRLPGNMSLPPLPTDLMNIPGSWDSSFNASAYPARVTPHQAAIAQRGMYNYPDLDLPPPPPLPLPPTHQNSRNAPNTLPPMRTHGYQGSRDSSMNLRALTLEQLEKRVKEKAREIEGARKEMEKAEKALSKKGKDLGRWTESVFKAVPV